MVLDTCRPSKTIYLVNLKLLGLTLVDLELLGLALVNLELLGLALVDLELLGFRVRVSRVRVGVSG